MGLFRRTKKLAVRAAQSVWDSSTVRDAEKYRRTLRPNDIAAQEAINRAIGVVHDCASKNADYLSQVPIRLMKRVDDSEAARRHFRSVKSAGIKAAGFSESGSEVEEITDHPILDLLSSPNPDFPGSQMGWLSWYMREITGKAYELIGWGGNGYPVALFPMPAQFVEAVYGDDGIEAFKYARAETSIADIDPADIIYYRHRVSRFNPLDGEGPLAGVLAEADLLTKNIMHDLAFVDRGNRPDSIMNIKDNLATEDQVNELERRLNARYGGAMNSNKTYVTKGEVTWTPLVWPEKELQSLLKIEHYEKRIRSAMGHTESMADSNASTYAAALVAENQYAKNTIRPRLNQDAAHKNAYLLPLFGLDPSDYCLVYDDPVKEDVEALSLRARADVLAGILTVNEARAEQGHDPIKDPAADELRVNGQKLSSLDAAPTGGGGLDIPPIFRTASKSVKPDLVKIALSGEKAHWTECGCMTKDDDDIANEPMIEQAFRDYLDKVEGSMEGVVREMQDEVLAAEREGRAPNLDRLSAEAATTLREQMEGVVNAGVRYTIEAAGADLDSMFEVAQRTALDFLDRHVIQVADDLAESTQTMIQPAIRNGIENGLSIDEIAKEIEGVPAWRAERIARTEVQNAAQGSRYETFKEIGVEEVEWVNAPGASKAHQAIAARGRRKVGEPFVKAGEVLHGEKFSRDVYYPPARPNCRCSISAIHDTSGGEE
jgi:phage portal protein BeeE